MLRTISRKPSATACPTTRPDSRSRATHKAEYHGKREGNRRKDQGRCEADGNLPPCEALVGDRVEVLRHPIPLPIVSHGLGAVDGSIADQADHQEILDNRSGRRGKNP